MSASVWTAGSDLSSAASTALKLAARCWFAVAVLGQWIFVYYVAVFYGGAALRNDFAAWNKVMPHGHVPGDPMGNVVIAVHLLLAVIIIVGGPLQLIPQIRSHAPAFHRWNGRVYMPVVFVTSLAGLYMVWRRGTVGDVVQHIGISLDAFLIMIFAVLALRYAVARDLKTHRRWALRLFMVVNGVWFFRVGLMLWVFLNQGPVGFDPKTFSGPFLSFLSFADYLLPLAVLELYFRVTDGCRIDWPVRASDRSFRADHRDGRGDLRRHHGHVAVPDLAGTAGCAGWPSLNGLNLARERPSSAFSTFSPLVAERRLSRGSAFREPSPLVRGEGAEGG